MKQALLDTNMLSCFLRGEENVVSKIDSYLQHYSYLTFSIFTYYETKSGLVYRMTRAAVGVDAIAHRSAI